MTPNPTGQRRRTISTAQRIALLGQAVSECWGAIVAEQVVGDSLLVSFENGQKLSLRLPDETDTADPKRRPIHYTVESAPDRPPPMGNPSPVGDLDRMEAERQDGGQGFFDGFREI